MVSKITHDVLDAQQYCRLKAYFRLRGEEGAKSDFEKLLFDMRQDLRAKAIGKIRRHDAEGDVETDVSLSRSITCPYREPERAMSDFRRAFHAGPGPTAQKVEAID
jgi:hypothetical protein